LGDQNQKGMITLPSPEQPSAPTPVHSLPFGLAGSARVFSGHIVGGMARSCEAFSARGHSKREAISFFLDDLNGLEVDYPNLSKLIRKAQGLSVFASRFCRSWRVSLACDWIIAFPIHNDADPYQGGSAADAPNQKEADGGQSVAAHFTVPSRVVA
jgi:hypothetical protein